jgi:hypothetical protein
VTLQFDSAELGIRQLLKLPCEYLAAMSSNAPLEFEQPPHMPTEASGMTLQ